MTAERLAARKGTLRIAFREGELRSLMLLGDLFAAGLGAYAAPMVWASFDPEFAPRADLRPFQIAFVAVWTVLFRLLGGGELASPRFGRRTLASVGRTTITADRPRRRFARSPPVGTRASPFHELGVGGDLMARLRDVDVVYHLEALVEWPLGNLLAFGAVRSNPVSGGPGGDSARSRAHRASFPQR